MVSRQPEYVRLRAYRVGFGDCLLLTVGYGAAGADLDERHMLIDMGTLEADDHGPSLSQVAGKLTEHCGPRGLEVLVATHRHRDHIRAFESDATQKIITELRPGLVVRPWTDVPEAQRTTGANLGLDERSIAFTKTLANLQSTADQVKRFGFDSERVAKRAEELAALGFTNDEAIAALEGWAEDTRGDYVRAGDEVAVARLLPGVTIEVLGPPTVAQVPRLTSYAKTSEEYWLALVDEDRWPSLQAPGKDAQRKALHRLAPPHGLGAAEWLLREFADNDIGQGLDLFEAFDDVLNNTSVILLVKVGDRTLLLPGDAQAENWSLTLDTALGLHDRGPDAALRQRLADVDLYKVGHHGSRNATPTSLYRLWSHRTPTTNPLTSVLTTKKDVFHKSKEGEVPKPRLVDALRERGPLYSTDTLDPSVWWFDLTAPANGPGQFVFSPGPQQPSP
jgi:hypothetical protein